MKLKILDEAKKFRQSKKDLQKEFTKQGTTYFKNQNEKELAAQQQAKDEEEKNALRAEEQRKQSEEEQQKREQEQSERNQRSANWKAIKDKINQNQFYLKSNDAIEDVTNLLKQYGIS